MSASIEVNKQSVKSFLETGGDELFIIPEYQRPYEWDEDQIQELFDDLWEFTTDASINHDEKSTYFLGCIVSYEDVANGEQEIIDGQQRITSLFLLLRAIYTKLDSVEDDENGKITHFIGEIAPTLWKTDKYNGSIYYSETLLKSRVLNNEGNDILDNILQKGNVDPEAKDNYSKNYIKFQELLDSKSSEDPLRIYDFIFNILNRAIVLPITADSQDMALTIFSTLNDKGLPLSDSDIFKAQIYSHLKDKAQKSEFIDKWKDLDIEATRVGESIQQLFYYYMFYLRAVANDNKSTTPGIRKYYTENAEQNLYADDLMDNLATILNVWKVVNNREECEEPWSSNKKILQSLDILTSYPNEFWKYPVIIYYLVYHRDNNFEMEFELFLNKLLVSLLKVYLITPTLNAVKSEIIKLDIAIIHSSSPQFNFKEIDESQLESKIKNPHPKAVRMLLKILAYDKQDDLLPIKWEIEHIFPQKWQSNYFPDVSDEIIKERIEHLGNKLPLEKKLNIVAGNGYFEKKKKEYEQSKIVITKEMAQYESDDWGLEDITERDVRVSDTILNILNKWNNNYDNVSPETSSNDEPTKEQKDLIEEFKKKGWV